LEQNNILWRNVPMDEKYLATFFRASSKLQNIIVTEKPDIIHAESRFPSWLQNFACFRRQTMR
jgi:hypothetical protein